MSNLQNIILGPNDQHPCQESKCSDELCVICYDNLIQPDKPEQLPFTIPECRHTFHQLCINSWFRQGNEKCPLCNDLGVGGRNNRRRSQFWGVHEDRFSLLNKLSKKKTAPKILIKEIERFKKKQDRIIKFKKEYTKWKETKIKINDEEELSIKELLKEADKKRRRVRKNEWDLKRLKRAVCERVNITPLILVEKKNIN